MSTSNTFTIKGFPLIKIQRHDRIEGLQKGKLYAKTLEYYREREVTTGDMTVGDSFEGMIHINEGYLRNPTTGEVITLNDTLIPTTESDMFSFCMLGVKPNTTRFEFTDKQKTELIKFGDTALIILDSDEFERRVKNAVDKAGYSVLNGFVNYYDSSEDNGNLILSALKDIRNVAMWKREEYSYQQEYRFVIHPNNHGDDHVILDIGDISDISVMCSAEEALNGLIERQ